MAFARAGGGFSGGSRGMRTFSAPSATRTAPTAAPIQRSMTQPRATAPAANAATRPGLFGGGLMGSLAAGFIGAGLFGLLFGHGLFGGMGGIGSLIGLALQLVLIVVVARLIFAWWQRRNMPASAFAGGVGNAGNAGGNTGGNTGFGFSPLGGLGMGGGAPASEPITIGEADYDAFERLLTQVQAAYSAEDLNALRARVTPEMLSYFSEQMSQNASRGLVNKVSGVHLEQGDLSEAWREGDSEYATVAMRFALTDSMVDRASGRVVEGGQPDVVTEVWTFVRARGGAWILSAIQQG
jgi:predicted lipid-binding transport protein (Tim44 family)